MRLRSSADKAMKSKKGSSRWVGTLRACSFALWILSNETEVRDLCLESIGTFIKRQ